MTSNPSRKICPRCNEPMNYFKNRRQYNRVYVYAVHLDKGKECYLGPKDGYVYVSKLHQKEGLVLKGYTDSGRVLEYLDAIINHVSNTEIDKETKQEIVDRVKRLLKALKVRSLIFG